MHRADGAMQVCDGGSVSEEIVWFAMKRDTERWEKRKQEEKMLLEYSLHPL